MKIRLIQLFSVALAVTLVFQSCGTSSRNSTLSGVGQRNADGVIKLPVPERAEGQSDVLGLAWHSSDSACAAATPCGGSPTSPA